MNDRLFRFLCVVAFAAALGHFAWHSYFGPTDIPDYVVGGEELSALTGPDPAMKQLYLRHLLFLPQRPRHAWLQVLALDEIAVYVNGRLLTQEEKEGFAVAAVSDLTPYL